MEVNGTDFDSIISSTPYGIVFNQTVTDEICVANAMASKYRK